jgi:hypothetical protein
MPRTRLWHSESWRASVAERVGRNVRPGVERLKQAAPCPDEKQIARRRIHGGFRESTRCFLSLRRWIRTLPPAGPAVIDESAAVGQKPRITIATGPLAGRHAISRGAPRTATRNSWLSLEKMMVSPLPQLARAIKRSTQTDRGPPAVGPPELAARKVLGCRQATRTAQPQPLFPAPAGDLTAQREEPNHRAAAGHVPTVT